MPTFAWASAGDAVSRHGHDSSLPLQFADDFGFSFGQDSGFEFGDVQLLGERGGDGFVVASEHNDTDAGLL